ncbi:MAG: hypothetical protein WKF40_03890 [Thermoleophilaceae bacterium]
MDDDGGNGNDDNGTDGFDVPGITAGAKCLARSLMSTSRGIGPLNIGMTRPRARAQGRARRPGSGRRAFRYCVQRRRPRCYVSFDGKGGAQMVVSVARPDSVRRGSPVATAPRRSARPTSNAKPLGQEAAGRPNARTVGRSCSGSRTVASATSPW